MQFSVIIPTCNRRALLARTLESVWAQRFTDFEVIVVDDGSTDDTSAWLASLGDRVRPFHQSNQGPGAARNLGAQKAQGDYLVFLDSDDLWFPWTLSCFAGLIEHHGRPAVLSAKLVEFSDEASLASVTDAPARAVVFDDYIASHAAGIWVGSGMSVLERTAFLRTGGYATEHINCEDHDLILRMGDARGFAQVTAPVTLAWRRHPGSATTDLPRSVAGCFYLVNQECRGAYPGGPKRRMQRTDILGRHVRPVALACLREGLPADGWRLYRATFGWHVRLGRWKFLFGFPLQALVHLARFAPRK